MSIIELDLLLNFVLDHKMMVLILLEVIAKILFYYKKNISFKNKINKLLFVYSNL